MIQDAIDDVFDLDFHVDLVTQKAAIPKLGTESCDTCGCTTTCDTCTCGDNC